VTESILQGQKGGKLEQEPWKAGMGLTNKKILLQNDG